VNHLMASHLQLLISWSILAALLGLGALTAFAVVAAVRIGGRREESLDDHDALSASRFTIPVTVIVPLGKGDFRTDDAEDAVGQIDSSAGVRPLGLNATVRSLLTLDYPEFEVIVVAEQLADRSIASLKAEWTLEPKEFFYRQSLGTSSVRRIYRSSRDPRLMVIDQASQGRADALNCGVNLARYRYIAVVTRGALFERDALLRAMAAALRDPGHVVATVSHLEPIGTDFDRLAALRSILASRILWRRLRTGLAAEAGVVIWRRDAVLQTGGFAAHALDPSLDLMVRLQAAQHGVGGESVVRTGETFGQTESRRFGDRLRGAVRRRAAAVQLLWRYRWLIGVGELGARTIPLFALTEVLAPAAAAWAVVGTIIAAAAGWLPWIDVGLVAVILSLGQALLTTAALLLRAARPEAPAGRELARLVLVAPLEVLGAWTL
jgi:hypothetical protein